MPIDPKESVQETEPVTEAVETETEGEEEPTSSFTSADVSKLAPELQTAYKGMQADYTRKMQSLAAQRKELQNQRQQVREPEQEREPQPESQADDRFARDSTFQKFDEGGQAFVRYMNGLIEQHVGGLRQEFIQDQLYQNALRERYALENKHGEAFTKAAPEINRLLATGKFRSIGDCFEYIHTQKQLRKLEDENKKLRVTASTAAIGRESASEFVAEESLLSPPLFRNMREADAWVAKQNVK